MNLRYLVDSDWAIDYLQGKPATVTRMDGWRNDGLGLSVASLAELYEGVYYSTDPTAREQGLLRFLDIVRLVSIDEEVCKLFAKERGRLRAAKKLISDFDLLIAVTAIRHNLILLTNNRRHFQLVEGLQIL